MNSKTKKSFSYKAKFIYLSLFLASLFLLTISHYLKERPLFEALTLELGIAGIIALILIFTFEKVTKTEREEATEKQIQDITQNLFNAIFKRYIPDSVFSEVERSLFTSDVIRTNYNVDYHISDVDEIKDFPSQDTSNHLRCSITSSYDLKNITDKEIEHTIKGFIELPIDESLQKFVKFTEFSVDNEVQNIDTKDNTNTGDHIVLTNKVKIGPKSKVSIKSRFITIKRKVDSEIWSSRIPSDGIKITVSSPPSITVKASANHSSKLNHSKRNDSNIIRSQEWSINTGIFPHQSIIFWWKDSKI